VERIAIASDHAGYALKELVKRHLSDKGYTVEDFGTSSEKSADYPDYIVPAARSVGSGSNDLGIVLGGSGNGEAMAANKVRGIRCALCWNRKSARLAREHNDANVISLGARMVSEVKALAIVDAWLTARFEGVRHIQRIETIGIIYG